MTNDLVNANMYRTGYVKMRSDKFAGGKMYLAKLVDDKTGKLLVGREEFKRASEAEAASLAWKARLVGEYDAAVLALVSGVETELVNAVVSEPTA